jgi:hypothetical protein
MMKLSSSRSKALVPNRGRLLTHHNSFSAVFARLLELGVPSTQWVSSEPWELKTLSEQKK